MALDSLFRDDAYIVYSLNLNRLWEVLSLEQAENSPHLQYQCSSRIQALIYTQLFQVIYVNVSVLDIVSGLCTLLSGGIMLSNFTWDERDGGGKHRPTDNQTDR